MADYDFMPNDPNYPNFPSHSLSYSSLDSQPPHRNPYNPEEACLDIDVWTPRNSQDWGKTLNQHNKDDSVWNQDDEFCLLDGRQNEVFGSMGPINEANIACEWHFGREAGPFSVEDPGYHMEDMVMETNQGFMEYQEEATEYVVVKEAALVQVHPQSVGLPPAGQGAAKDSAPVIQDEPVEEGLKPLAPEMIIEDMDWEENAAVNIAIEEDTQSSSAPNQIDAAAQQDLDALMVAALNAPLVDREGSVDFPAQVTVPATKTPPSPVTPVPVPVSPAPVQLPVQVSPAPAQLPVPAPDQLAAQAAPAAPAPTPAETQVRRNPRQPVPLSSPPLRRSTLKRNRSTSPDVGSRHIGPYRLRPSPPIRTSAYAPPSKVMKVAGAPAKTAPKGTNMAKDDKKKKKKATKKAAAVVQVRRRARRTRLTQDDVRRELQQLRNKEAEKTASQNEKRSKRAKERLARKL